MDVPQSFSAFLAFIGTPVFAAFVVSEVLDQIDAFNNATSQVKTAVTMALYIALGLISYGLVHWVPATVATEIQPIYAVIVGSIAAFLGGQLWHSQTTGKTTVTATSSTFSSPTGETTSKTATVQSTGSGEALKVEATPATPRDMAQTPPTGTASMAFAGTGAQPDSSIAPSGTFG